MISKEIIDGLKVKFSEVYPLIFQRSVERARSGGELFDILSDLPAEYPLFWSENERKWTTTEDIFQVRDILEKESGHD